MTPLFGGAAYRLHITNLITLKITMAGIRLAIVIFLILLCA